jgi:hypothetical protein
VVTLGVTNEPIRHYLGVAADSLERVEELQQVEAAHARTWVVVTFPVLFEARQADVAEWLRGRYDTAAVFPGSVGGGAIVVLVRGQVTCLITHCRVHFRAPSSRSSTRHSPPRRARCRW